MSSVQDDLVLTSNSTKLSSFGKLLIGISGGVAIGLTCICVPFISPALRKICLPYVPATDTQVSNVFHALRGATGKLIDLGSGDGRIVIEAAKRNFEAHGVELNPWLILYSKYSAFRLKLDKTRFFRSDLWKFDISSYNHVVIFGVEEMMTKIENKMQNEGRNGTVIVACRFPLPNWKAQHIIGSGIDTVWVYKM